MTQPGDRFPTVLLRETVGACPHCSPWRPGAEPAVVYRSSSTSVTMRCKVCELQWTMTHRRIKGMSEAVRKMTTPGHAGVSPS